MKIHFPVLICLLLITQHIFSQTDPALKYAATITGEGLKKQLSVIASADMEGRETGTEGQRKAAAYIEGQFREAGLMPAPSLSSYQQYYTLLKDTLIPKTLKIGKQNYEFGKDYIVTSGTSGNSEFRSKHIIFAGYGIAAKNYDDYDGRDVKGKLVVIFTGEPKKDGIYSVSGTSQSSTWQYNISGKAMLAKQKGATALLVINPSMDTIATTLVENSKRSSIYVPDEKQANTEKVPVITTIPRVLKTIFGDQEVKPLLEAARAGTSLKEYKAEKKVRSKLVYVSKKTTSAASNIIGFIEGSDKKGEYLFLTAHYDHLGKKGDIIYYGADDDGSGTAGVIEMAKAFAKAKADGFMPRRTIVFMTVSGEEKGLWGSAYYSGHPLFPMDSTTADLNIDMVGRLDPGRTKGDSTNYIYVIGDDKLSTDLKPVTTSVNKTYTKLELDYKFNDPDDPERIYFRSDHYNFARKGVPVIFFFDGIHADYHKPTDTVDKINFDVMEKRVRFIFLTAWSIANRDNMMKRDLPIPEE